MHFSVPQPKLESFLRLPAGIVESSSDQIERTLLYWSINTDKLIVVGTNFEVEIHGKMVLSDIPLSEPLEFTAPARELMAAVRVLSKASAVDLVVEDDGLLIQSGKNKYALQHAAPRASLNIRFFEPEEPLLECTIDSQELHGLLKSTAFAMGIKDTRYYLNAMLFEVTPEHHLTVVATNGHRLAQATSLVPLSLSEQDQKAVASSAMQGKQTIVPRKAVGELIRILDTAAQAPVELVFSERLFCARVGEQTKIITKLIDGKYPDYTKVIPAGGDKIFTGERVELLRSCERAASIASTPAFLTLHLSESEPLRVTVDSSGKYKADIGLEGEYKGPALEVTFQANYLQDILKTLSGETITLSLVDQRGGSLMQSPSQHNVVHVVMPVNL